MSKESEFFIGSIDQGTTSTRFIIYDGSAKAIASHQIEFTQFYPVAGYFLTHFSALHIMCLFNCVLGFFFLKTFDG